MVLMSDLPPGRSAAVGTRKLLKSSYTYTNATGSNPLIPVIVSIAGILAGLLSLNYAPSAWYALAPFVLAIWISPAPLVTGGLVTLLLLAAGALSIMGRLPNGLQESFAIGTGMALSCQYSGFTGKKPPSHRIRARYPERYRE